MIQKGENKMKKIGPRVTEQTETFLKSNFRSLSAGAEYITNAAPSVMKKFIGQDIKTRFLREELLLMVDVMNGTMLTAGIAGQHLPLNVADGIQLDRLDEKWEVDGPALEEKLKTLSTPDLFFLEVWIQGFWEQLGTEDEIPLEEYVKAAL